MKYKVGQYLKIIYRSGSKFFCQLNSIKTMYGDDSVIDYITVKYKNSVYLVSEDECIIEILDIDEIQFRLLSE